MHDRLEGSHLTSNTERNPSALSTTPISEKQRNGRDICGPTRALVIKIRVKAPRLFYATSLGISRPLISSCVWEHAECGLACRSIIEMP